MKENYENENAEETQNLLNNTDENQPDASTPLLIDGLNEFSFEQDECQEKKEYKEYTKKIKQRLAIDNFVRKVRKHNKNKNKSCWKQCCNCCCDCLKSICNTIGRLFD